MKTVRIVFQGDSITDAGRDRSDPHNLGNGYPKYTAALLQEAYPDVEFEFYNFGISGNRTSQLFDRIYTQGISQEPDIISIMIGVNDVWHRFGPERIYTTDEQVKLNYTCILERLKKETNAKILLLQPYTDGDAQAMMRPDVIRVKAIVDDLAEKYADAYVKTDDIIRADEHQGEEGYFTRDGVHPSESGAEYIAKLYLDAVKPLIDEIPASE